MAATNDTIDGLLAEFRGYSAGMPASYHVTMSWADFRKMLDRFDAAHRREKAAIEADALAVGGIVEAAHKRERGDCAKLREALVSVQKKIHYLIGTLNVPNSLVANRMEINGIINAALAAPPRNCDIYLTEEAVDAATVTVRDCVACSRIDMEAPCVFCMVRWLLAPATEKEGGTK